jgi:hypothetical protein
MHPSTSWSSQWFLSFWLPHQYPICIPLLPIPASHPPWLAHSKQFFLCIWKKTSPYIRANAVVNRN